METRANHILVGLFVLVLTLTAAAIALWFARAQLDQRVDVYEVVFRTSVAGLQNGAQVNYRGIQVGRVTRISFDPNDVARVLVRIEVEPTTPITDDTVARLQPQGITGLFNIELSGGTNVSARLPSRPNDPAEIPGVPSTLDRLTTDAPELLAQGVDLLKRASRLLNDENLAHVSSVLADLEELTDGVASRRVQIEDIIDQSALLVTNLRAATETAQTSLERLDKAAAVVERDIDAMLAAGTTSLGQFGAAAERMESAARQADILLRDVREPVNDFAQGGLYEFDALISEARLLVATATRIAREFERDPAGFLLGGSFQGFQAD